jgi:hypothetical protein
MSPEEQRAFDAHESLMANPRDSCEPVRYLLVPEEWASGQGLG